MILLVYPSPEEEKMKTARHSLLSRSPTSTASVAEIKLMQQPQMS